MRASRSRAKAISGGLLICATVVCIGASGLARSNEILQYPPIPNAGATADIALIQDLLRKGQFDKAMTAVDALEKKQPKNPSTFNLKGAVYLEQNDFAKARKSFEHAAGLDPNAKAAIVNLAQLDLREKKPEAARERWQGLLARDKTDFQAMLGLANVAAATGKEAEYVTWLQKAADAAPSAVRPRILLANYHMSKNDARKALAIAREAQIANPGNAEALELLGTAQLMAGEKENAVVTFGRQVARSPSDPVAHFKLASAQVAMQNVGAATVSLQKSLALRPDYLDAQVLLASVELGAQRYGEASKIAQRIQEQHPQSAAGFGLQGNILMAQKQFGPALKAYEKALELNKSSPLAVKVHQALSEAGKTKEADARLLQWLGDQPTDVVVRTYLAGTYLKAGQHKPAVEQYQFLLDADPKNVRALNDLAWLYQQEKDPRALATAERAYQVASDRPETIDTLGWILIERGDTARGLELLQRASAKAPGSAEIRYHLAVALVKSGDNARARKVLEDLLAKNANFPQRQEAQTLLRQL